MTIDLEPGTLLQVAAGTSFTRLPFGGAVLVHGQSLALAEYGERDGQILQLLLTRGVPDSARWTAVQPLVAPLIEAGWLIVRRGDPDGGE